jgi:flavin-dependent dehydrogenase
MNYDVIVVGGRCAGASIGNFLARGGARVLVLEQARLPSDQVLSTHAIRPRGMEVLDELGVGDEVRSAPALRVLRLRKNGAFIDSRYPAGRSEHAPRRLRLDALLVAAARGAGVEVVDEARVRGLLWDGPRVAGVRVRLPTGEAELRAGLVVGADGRHSLVARAVKAREYLGYTGPRAMYWSYWDASPLLGASAEYGFDMYFAHVGHEMRIMYPTDDGQILAGYLPRLAELSPFRQNPEGALIDALGADEWIAPIVRARAPNERVRAVSKERYFFREAAGPGWLLVGDAGLHKEFVTGDGITEALLQAKSAASAVLTGGDAERERFWRERDVAALEFYCFGQDQGTEHPAEDLDELIFARMSREPELANLLARVLDRELSPYDSLPLTTALGALGTAFLRRRFDVFAQFLARGKRRGAVKRELALRRRLLSSSLLGKAIQCRQ